MRPRPARPLAAVGAVLLVATLCGCVGGEPAGLEIVASGRPTRLPAEGRLGGPVIGWADREHSRLALLTWGSGSCPDVPAAVTRVGPHELVLRMRRYRGVCTADHGPFRTVFRAPAGLRRTGAFTVRLEHSAPQADVVLRSP